MTNRVVTNRVGRPRTRGTHDPARTPRQEILDAAAGLFTELGYAGTSTRAIADRVGVRQASLYYHFAGKDEILLELLEASVRPTLGVVDGLREQAPDAASALHALVVIDVGTLLAGPLGVPALYLAPEVRLPVFQDFRDHRAQLGDVYAELAARAAPPGHPVPAVVLGQACLHLVEMVTSLPAVPGVAEHVAATCLAAVGVHGPDAAAATAASADLRGALAVAS